MTYRTEYEDIDARSDSFTNRKCIPDYRKLGRTALWRRLAKNTGFNYGQQKEILVLEYMDVQTIYTFDTDRSWVGQYVMITTDFSPIAAITLPEDVNTGGASTPIMVTQLTSSFALFGYGALYIRSRAAGGFELYDSHAAPPKFAYMLSILGLRKVSGTTVTP